MEYLPSNVGQVAKAARRPNRGAFRARRSRLSLVSPSRKTPRMPHGQAARVRAVRIPMSRHLGASPCLGEARFSKIRIGSGRRPGSPDSRSADEAGPAALRQVSKYSRVRTESKTKVRNWPPGAREPRRRARLAGARLASSGVRRLSRAPPAASAASVHQAAVGVPS